MGFNDTITQLGILLTDAISDLNKVCKGNKSAAQRVRVGTINIAKIAKKFRKESVLIERKSLAKKSVVLKRKRSSRMSRRKAVL